MSEHIYKLIGGHSYYQYFILMFIIISQFNTSLNILLPIFINNYQDFYCEVPKNQTSSIYSQNRKQFKQIDNKTGLIVIDSLRCNFKIVNNICLEINMKKYPMTSTIRSQYNLYCEYYGLSSIATLMFMIGICLGSMFGGIFSDKFGRMAGCVLSYYMISVFATIAAFSPWYTLHIIARFINGFAVSLEFVANSAMALEIVEINHRTNFGFCWSLGYDCGYLILVFLAYSFRNHFTLQMAVCLVSYIALTFPFFYKESFRWLLTNKNYDKAKNVIMHIAKFNKKCVSETQVDKCIEIFDEERLRTEARKVSIKEVLKFKTVLINLLILWFIFFSSSFSYYAFLLGSSKISNELFIATVISAGASFFARAIYMFLCQRFGRISILLSLQLGVAILFIASMILKYFYGVKNMITTVLLMVSISLSGTNFGFMWTYGGEAFPTVIRSTSVSIGSACSRISGMIASQMEWIFEISPNALPIIGMIMSLLGSLFTLFILPETYKRPSPDFLQQAEKQFLEWRQPWRKRPKIFTENGCKA